MLRYNTRSDMVDKLNKLIEDCEHRIHKDHEIARLWDNVKFNRKKDGKPFKLLSKALYGAKYDYYGCCDKDKDIIVESFSDENGWVKDCLHKSEIRQELERCPGYDDDEPVYKMKLDFFTNDEVYVPERILMKLIKKKAALFKELERGNVEELKSLKPKGEQAIDKVLEFRNQLSKYFGEDTFKDFEINVIEK